jgi:hypothetical protein
VGSAYTWGEAEGYVRQLNTLCGEYGRGDEPFEIMLSCSSRRHRMSTGEPRTWASPRWSAAPGPVATPCCPATRLVKLAAERYREPIERFADPVIAKLR